MNLELAIDAPSDKQDQLTLALVEGLIAMPAKVRARQAVLARCLAHL